MNSTIMKRSDGSTSAPSTSFSNLVDEFFQDNLSRFFDDSFRSTGRSSNQRGQVPVNIRETDKNYEMEIIAPGLRKEDFKVDVNGDTLTVSFEHKEENKEENKQSGWIRQEYKKHSFSRSFNVDDTVDVGKIAARYADGMLQLTLPKKEGSQRISKTIEIK